MRRDDRIRTTHMVEAAETVGVLIVNRTRQELDTDVMLRLALVRAIEIIGEAAGRVSSDARAAGPTIPWLAIVSTRNRLSHAYFDIDYDIVWQTATVEVPALLPMLREILSAGEDSRESLARDVNP